MTKLHSTRSPGRTRAPNGLGRIGTALASGQLELSNTSGKTTIKGLGDDQLTVGGNNASRVFLVDVGVTAEISGLSVSDGFDDSSEGNEGGAGIFNRGTLTITGSTLSGNRTGC